MPNWCYNTLKVNGIDDKEVARFKKQAERKGVEGKSESTPLSFNNFVPLPEELKGGTSPVNVVSKKEYEIARVKHRLAELKREKTGVDVDFNFVESLPITKEMQNDFKKRFGVDNWYDWQVKNWGTKWDCNNAVLESDEETYLEYQFDTAWSPPITWLKSVIKLYPTLEFRLKYEEEGMGFMGKVEAEGGKIIKDESIS